MREQIIFGELEIEDVFFFKRIHRKKEEVIEAVKIESGFARNYMIRTGRSAGQYGFFHDEQIVEIEN